MLDIFNESEHPLEGLEELIQDLFSFSNERFGFQRPPSLFLRSDSENAKNALGRTGSYDPSKMEIMIFVDKRHPKDILRSISHELIHHMQNLRGDFDRDFDTSEGYAQNDPHLRNMEEEAYSAGNLCFRDWEDSRKQQLAESICYNNIIGGDDMSEDKRIPLKEWKNAELNSQLMKKFGLVNEESGAGAEQLYHEETTAENVSGEETLEEDEEPESTNFSTTLNERKELVVEKRAEYYRAPGENYRFDRDEANKGKGGVYSQNIAQVYDRCVAEEDQDCIDDLEMSGDIYQWADRQGRAAKKAKQYCIWGRCFPLPSKKKPKKKPKGTYQEGIASYLPVHPDKLKTLLNEGWLEDWWRSSTGQSGQSIQVGPGQKQYQKVLNQGAWVDVPKGTYELPDYVTPADVAPYMYHKGGNPAAEAAEHAKRRLNPSYGAVDFHAPLKAGPSDVEMIRRHQNPRQNMAYANQQIAKLPGGKQRMTTLTPTEEFAIDMGLSALDIYGGFGALKWARAMKAAKAAEEAARVSRIVKSGEKVAPKFGVPPELPPPRKPAELPHTVIDPDDVYYILDDADIISSTKSKPVQPPPVPKPVRPPPVPVEKAAMSLDDLPVVTAAMRGEEAAQLSKWQRIKDWTKDLPVKIKEASGKAWEATKTGARKTGEYLDPRTTKFPTTFNQLLGPGKQKFFSNRTALNLFATAAGTGASAEALYYWFGGDGPFIEHEEGKNYPSNAILQKDPKSGEVVSYYLTREQFMGEPRSFFDRTPDPTKFVKVWTTNGREANDLVEGLYAEQHRKEFFAKVGNSEASMKDYTELREKQLAGFKQLYDDGRVNKAVLDAKLRQIMAEYKLVTKTKEKSKVDWQLTTPEQKELVRTYLRSLMLEDYVREFGPGSRDWRNIHVHRL